MQHTNLSSLMGRVRMPTIIDLIEIYSGDTNSATVTSASVPPTSYPSHWMYTFNEALAHATAPAVLRFCFCASADLHISPVGIRLERHGAKRQSLRVARSFSGWSARSPAPRVQGAGDPREEHARRLDGQPVHCARSRQRYGAGLEVDAPRDLALVL